MSVLEITTEYFVVTRSHAQALVAHSTTLPQKPLICKHCLVVGLEVLSGAARDGNFTRARHYFGTPPACAITLNRMFSKT
ncbi:hypothetical protein J6590_060174 [Homalodisca vitripennis]|nr:hypothetical protein J6590_060174 [Homalodisca vitripennis]